MNESFFKELVRRITAIEEKLGEVEDYIRERKKRIDDIFDRATDLTIYLIRIGRKKTTIINIDGRMYIKITQNHVWYCDRQVRPECSNIDEYLHVKNYWYVSEMARGLLSTKLNTQYEDLIKRLAKGLETMIRDIVAKKKIVEIKVPFRLPDETIKKPELDNIWINADYTSYSSFDIWYKRDGKTYPLTLNERHLIYIAIMHYEEFLYILEELKNRAKEFFDEAEKKIADLIEAVKEAEVIRKLYGG